VRLQVEVWAAGHRGTVLAPRATSACGLRGLRHVGELRNFPEASVLSEQIARPSRTALPPWRVRRPGDPQFWGESPSA
jgi:hypothetical protein